MGRDEMRAGDSDRQQVVDRLKRALDEGRLDLHEYDERVQRAYAAKTYGEFAPLVADLPLAGAVRPVTSPVAPVKAPGATGQWIGAVWASWAGVVGICVAIWGITSLIGFDLEYFWPMWVAGPWALILVFTTIGGIASGAPQQMMAERERKELEKQHKRERKALQARAIERGELPANPSKEERRRFIDEAIARGELPPRPEKA